METDLKQNLSNDCLPSESKPIEYILDYKKNIRKNIKNSCVSLNVFDSYLLIKFTDLFF